MRLKELEQHWQAFGEQDPLWAILSAPGKRGGAWDLDEFFATGRSEVETIIDALSERGIAIGHRRALDFGCGVGRLTNALADHFELCDGVDLARSMIDRADALNRNCRRVSFHHNEAPNLRLFGNETFDFVLSLLVLQHMAPELMRGYIREFLRVLRRGGITYFNIPDRRVVAAELPAGAWRASLSLIQELPEVLPGHVVPLAMTLRNDSEVAWPASAQLQVGNHWYSSNGTLMLFDDARAAIDTDLAPGQAYPVLLHVKAPPEAGNYVLEVDVVQEQISWFADRGSNTLRTEVSVRPADDRCENRAANPRTEPQAILPLEPDPAFSPTMEMHVMSRQDVSALVEEVGGVVLDSMPSHHGVPAHPSIEYVVVRPAVRIGALAHRDASTVSADAATRLRTAMDTRRDLTGFELTSTMRRLAWLSIMIRRLLRRAMLQVLHRQSEFNHATTELADALQGELDELATAIKDQRDLLADIDQRLARLEVKQLATDARVEETPEA
jgi:SAM-dependent methyltransferase